MKKYFSSFIVLAMAFSFISTVSAFSYPSQVTGLRVAAAGETSIEVSWKEASSAEDIIIGYRVYYGLKSVQEEGSTYDTDIFVSGKETTKITGLIPGTTYYVAVTALDSEENESEQYSVEAMVTTLGDIPVAETCDDGIMNQSEEDIDCGGECAACIVEPEYTCDDGIMNGAEEDIDCGGECEPCVVAEPEIVIEEPIVIDEPEVFGPETPDKFKPAAPDLIAPLEAMNLRSDVSKISDESIVILNWDKSLNIDQDVTDQILHVRKNMGDWDDGYSIGKDIETMELDVERGAMYEYKIVTLDSAGNFTESSTHSFTTELAKSGPAGYMGIAVAVFMFLGLGIMAARRHS